jgi:hypothetical protein
VTLASDAVPEPRFFGYDLLGLNIAYPHIECHPQLFPSWSPFIGANQLKRLANTLMGNVLHGLDKTLSEHVQMQY